MSTTTTNAISRRTALKTTFQTAAGAALVIGLEVPRGKAANEKPLVNPLTSWIKIDDQGKITLSYSKSEMGQGISTSLPMILAEELGADWKDVRVEHAPLDRAFGPQGTGGSGSITTLYTPLRQAGAAARTMLVAAAAQHWNISPADCKVRNSAVWHGSDKLSFRELVEAAAKLPVPDLATVALKDPAEFEVIGKSLPRTDIPAKTNGSAIFGLDVRLPNMVYAVVARCPVFGGKV
jgi:isoquinoline 1-oxidoreductase beta subunit